MTTRLGLPGGDRLQRRVASRTGDDGPLRREPARETPCRDRQATGAPRPARSAPAPQAALLAA